MIDQGEADGRAGLPYVCHIRRVGNIGAEGITIFMDRFV